MIKQEDGGPPLRCTKTKEPRLLESREGEQGSGKMVHHGVENKGYAYKLGSNIDNKTCHLNEQIGRSTSNSLGGVG